MGGSLTTHDRDFIKKAEILLSVLADMHTERPDPLPTLFSSRVDLPQPLKGGRG